MTIYFAANEPDAFYGDPEINTSGTYHDNDFSRCAMKLSTGHSLTLELPTEIGAADADGWWLHFRISFDTGDPALFDLEDFFSCRDGSSALSAYSYYVQNGIITFSAVGAGGTRADATNWDIVDGAGAYYNVDVHCYTSGGNAVLVVYMDGGIIATASVTGENNRGIKSATLSCPYTGTYSIYLSEFIVADEDTRNYRCGTYYPSSDGTHTDGTGAYSDIDETTTDSAAITLASVGDKQSWGITKHGTHGTAGIRAVCLNGLLASDTVNDLQALIYMSSVDYNSADLGISGSPRPLSVPFNTRPDTSSPWGLADLTDFEFGVEVV